MFKYSSISNTRQWLRIEANIYCLSTYLQRCCGFLSILCNLFHFEWRCVKNSANSYVFNLLCHDYIFHKNNIDLKCDIFILLSKKFLFFILSPHIVRKRKKKERKHIYLQFQSDTTSCSKDINYTDCFLNESSYITDCTLQRQGTSRNTREF